jgi:hypothetical protein
MKALHVLKYIQLSIAAGALLLAQAVNADQLVTSPSFGLPVHVNAVVDETGCQNHPGPTVTLSGNLSLGSVEGKGCL